MKMQFNLWPRFSAVISILALSVSVTHAQVTAVDFGGNYNDSNENAVATLTYEDGDFDGDAAADDRRGYIAIDTLFTSITDTNMVGNNTVFNAGYQSTYLDSTVGNPLIGIYRFNGSQVDPDALQAGSGATNVDNYPSTTTFAPNVAKANFLNGAESETVSNAFEDAAGSVTFTSTTGNGGPFTVRALVQSGSNWYISDATSEDDLSFNGATTNWFPYDPDTNMYISAGTLTGGVLGSTLTDIQAFGVVAQANTAAGQTSNQPFFRLVTMSASMVQIALPPPTPAVDFGGDYNDTNSTGGAVPALVYENGDFDGDSLIDDRRGYNPMSTSFPTGSDDNNVGTNLAFNAGSQVTYFDLISADPLRGIYRFFGRNIDTDSHQVGTGATADGVGQTFTYAPNISKENFLNGFDNPVFDLSFRDADSIVIDTIKQKGDPHTFHAIVKNGSDWFISASSQTNTGVLTINGYTETWHPYDPDTNLIIPVLTGGVAGSTLTNIQAVGMVAETTAPAGESNNYSIFRLLGLTVLMDQSLPVAAVDFGGDYNDNNTSGGAVPELVYENGDFDGDSLIDDRRGYNPMSTSFPTGSDDNNVGTNLAFNAGSQVTYFDLISADPLRGIYRFFGRNIDTDSHQVGTGATADGVGQTFTYAPNISKENFLNGFDNPVFDLSFRDADSIVIDTIKMKGDPHTFHAIVKNGSDWFISASSQTNTGVLTINGYTETWHPYDPDTNLIIPVLTGGVAGSTLTNIQAVGMVGETTAPAGESNNYSIFRLLGLTVLMDQSLPTFPPTTPVQVRNAATQYENDSSDNIHTFANFRVINAPDSKLVVAVGGEATGDATSVTYGGVNLTLVESINNQDVSIWYLDDPAAGDADIVVTLTNNQRSRIVALSLGNAADGIGSKVSGQDGDTVQLDLNLATGAPNTLLVGAFVNNASEINSTPFSASGETVVNAPSGSSRMDVGFITVVEITDSTYSWVNNVSSRSSAVLIGISPAGVVAPIGDLSSFDNPVVAVTPTIDGVRTLGEWGDAFQIPMIWPDLGVLPNVGSISFTNNDGSGNVLTAADAVEEDISAVFSFKWDATNLYILAEITDDVFIKPFPGGSGFPDDHFLLAIDPDTTTDGPGTVFLAEIFINSSDVVETFFLTGQAISDPDLNNFANHTLLGSEVPGGYVIEMALNWADLGVSNPVATDMIGVSMLLVENDIDDGGRDIIMRSSGSGESASIVTPSLYHQVTLSGPFNSFENFISKFDVGVFNDPTDDPDFDNSDNFTEYALGGNPSVSDATSIQTVSEFAIQDEADVFAFTYNRRLGASALGLTYEVKGKTDLTDPTWSASGITEAETTVLDDEFEAVTVTTPLDSDNKFLRLEVN